MRKIGDVVLYRTAGLCLVSDIRTESFSGQAEEYYILKPCADEKSVVYIPLNNTVLCEKMHTLLSREEILSLIDSFPFLEISWQENDKRRSEEFRAVIESGDRHRVAGVIKTIFKHRLELEEKGKKLRSSDEILFHQAQKLLFEEFSFVLDIPTEELPGFIEKRLNIS